MAFAMVSLAGIPPLAGFFGKFLLFKAALDQGPVAPALYWLVGIAIVGVVISIWYYFGVIRVMYWSAPAAETGSIRVPGLLRVVLLMCIVGMLLLGILPEPMMKITRYADGVFGKPAAASQTALTVRAPAQH